MLGLGSVVPWLGSTVQVLSVLLIRIFRFSIIFLGWGEGYTVYLAFVEEDSDPLICTYHLLIYI